MENLINFFWQLLQLGFLIIATSFVFLFILVTVVGTIKGLKNYDK